jgi:hypothetical protein
MNKKTIGSGDGASPSIGALLGEHGGTLRDGKRVLDKQIVSHYGSSVTGTWREGSFTGNSES